MTPPRPSADSARQRLLNHSRERGEDFQRVLTRYGLERLLYRLSISAHFDQFVLKGAMLFALWTDVLDHRPTKDLDLLGRGPPVPERLARVFRDVCTQTVDDDDGIDSDPASVTARAIREDAVYDGIRIMLDGRLGQARMRLQVDVGFDGRPLTAPHRRVRDTWAPMSQTARDLATRALGLPEEERLALAAELIDSVEGPADPEWEAAWLEELERRRARGVSDAKPWSEVRARLLRRLSGS